MEPPGNNLNNHETVKSNAEFRNHLHNAIMLTCHTF